MTAIRKISRSDGGRTELEALRARLHDAEELVRAFQNGEVDAIVRTGPSGEQVFTLAGADHAYRVMVETMSEGAATITSGGVILYSNRRLADLLHRDLDRVIGANLREFVVPNDAVQFDTLLRQSGGDGCRARVRLQAEGVSIPTCLAMRSFSASEDQSIVLVVTDLSELTKAETLRDQLARIVQSARDGIVGSDLSDVVTSWNRGAESIYGYGADAIVGQNIDKLVAPESKPRLHELFANIHRGEKSVRCDMQHLTRSGLRIDVDLSISPLLGHEEAVVGMSTIVRDISASKRAEEQSREAAQYARTLIEAGPDPLFVISPEGKVTDVNEATVKITGVARANFTGSDFREYFDDPVDARETYEQAFAQGLVLDRPMTMLCRAGAHIPVLCNASVYKDLRGKVRGLCCAIRDVTAQRNAATTMAEQRNRELEKLAELERFQKLTVDRELKMIDLKNEIAKLRARLPADKHP